MEAGHDKGDYLEADQGVDECRRAWSELAYKVKSSNLKNRPKTITPILSKNGAFIIASNHFWFSHGLRERSHCLTYYISNMNLNYYLTIYAVSQEQNGV